MSGLVEFARIAWPGLLVLAGFVALIIHAARQHRRRHPRGRWRIRFDGPLGVVTAEHELTEEQAGRFAILAQHLVGQERLRGGPRPTHREPLARRWVRDYDQEQAEQREAGRTLASRRDDLIAQGVNPRELVIPLAPDYWRQP
jgi:hypothetical protein